MLLVTYKKFRPAALIFDFISIFEKNLFYDGFFGIFRSELTRMNKKNINGFLTIFWSNMGQILYFKNYFQVFFHEKSEFVIYFIWKRFLKKSTKIGQRFGHHLGPSGQIWHWIRNPRSRITYNWLLINPILRIHLGITLTSILRNNCT